MITSDMDRRTLIRIAREAIIAHFLGVAFPAVEDNALAQRRGGAFVTVLEGNALRGCIGHVEADERLVHVVARCAVAACVSDPRFAPVAQAELGRIAIEVSLLGRLEPIIGPSEVEVGRHGLMVVRGADRGVLLPQVATVWEWDADQFLEETCRKAGLAGRAWREGASLWRFEAEVFHEGR